MPKAERTFFLNTLQRWISRTPHSKALHCKHSLVPSCVFTTLALEWALFRILPLPRGTLLLKRPLKQCEPWPTFTARSTHRGDSELAEHGNQNRRARLMPGGREEGWTNTNLLILSLIG